MKKLYPILFALLFLGESLVLQAVAQEFPLDPANYASWKNAKAYELSKDHQWLYFNESAVNLEVPLTLFYLHTKTGEKRFFNGFKNLSLSDNNVVIGSQRDTLVLTALDTPNAVLKLPDVIAYHNLRKSNLLLTQDRENTLKLIQIHKKLRHTKILFTDQQVTRFLVSPTKNTILYQKKGHPHSVYTLNLQTLESTKIADITPELKAVTWNKAEDAFVVYQEDTPLELVDIKKKKVQTIPLAQVKKLRFKVEFLPQGDVYIEYNTLTNRTDSTSTYVDIWNSNTRSLLPSNFKLKHQILYQAYLYHTTTEILEPLARNKDHSYLTFGVPDRIFTYNPFEIVPFKNSTIIYSFSILNLKTHRIESILLPTHSPGIIRIAPDKRKMLYPSLEDGDWNLYDFETRTNTFLQAIPMPNQPIRPVWPSDSKRIYFQQQNDLVCYHVDTHKIEQLTHHQPDKNIIQPLSFTLNSSSFDDSQPQYFIGFNPIKSVIFKLNHNRMQQIYETPNFIRLPENFKFDDSTNAFVFTEENINQAPIVKILAKDKVKTVYTDYIPKELYNWRTVQTISFTDKFGKTLKGILKYPKDFDPSKKYPLIALVYNSFSYTAKKFVTTDILMGNGQNDSFYTENGYFVYNITTYVSEEVPGLAATDCVLKGLDAALAIEPAIDPAKLGLIGHSFGGYKTSFIATQTDRFQAIISYAGAHDLLGGLTFRYSQIRHIPDWGMAENGQMSLNESYAENPQKYIDNSPLMQAYKVQTPILLATGLNDFNIYWENTEHMFIALMRFKKPVIALFYKNSGHSMTKDDPLEAIDLTTRFLQWFDYHLKGKQNTTWIKEGLDPLKPTYSKLDEL